MTKLSIFFFYLALMALWGCSTTNHAVLPTMAYHDITSHYNAYFNANEKLKNTLKLAEAAHRDKFDSVIPVYYYTDPKEFASYSGDMEDIVKRSTQAIQYHAVSNWSDDHMLLIAKASFLKGDYGKAIDNFKYITTQYKEGVDYVKVQRALKKKVGKYVAKKRKPKKPQVKVIVNKDGTKTLEKEDNRPEITVWLHTPARSEALVWLINSYTRLGRFDEAQAVVTYVRSDDLFYKNYDPQLELADADLQVTRKNYRDAIDPLEKYLKFKKIRRKKRLKTRPLFVLAQCYEATENYGKAIENYKAVLKNRPNYDMEFYAKLKMAKLGRKGSTDNAAIKSLLARMSKDGKYKDYWDQIYYEMALIALQENNNSAARGYLHKSIDYSTTNDDQKALSFLTLAELDYKEELYVSAKFYYDSTMQFMAKNDSRYPDVELREKMLDNLVAQLNIISAEDSLQRLASMGKEQLDKYIKEAIARKEREEEEKKEKLEADKQQQQLDNFKGVQNGTTTAQTSVLPGSSWYFYNTATRSVGYNDFIKKWGRRKLEENWRRKNKSSVTFEEEETAAKEDSTGATDTKGGTATTGTPEEQLLAGIPTTPEKLENSNDRLADAYYTAGTIYKDGLENDNKARDMFEALNNRLKKHKLLLESYYNLYLIAQKQNDKERVEKYKNLILAEFPQSVIAKILRDPNFINETKRQEQMVNDYYADAFNDYSTGKLDSAWYKSKMSDVVFKPNPLAPKFELLLALILAKQNRLQDYVQALNKIINRSTDTEVKNTAAELLTRLNKSSLPQIDLSRDTAQGVRDSLNFLYGVVNSAPDTSQMTLVKQLEDVKAQAKKAGADVKVDTSQKAQVVLKDTAQQGAAINTAVKDTAPLQPVVVEDTTSAYKRTEGMAHYFIIYIKDPALPQSAVMSTMAKVDAFNSSQFSEKRLQAKQIVIDSKNKAIIFRQFKNSNDAMAYFKVVKGQSQLFNDMKPDQYGIGVISTDNFSTLTGEKDFDAYLKFFRRVYK